MFNHSTDGSNVAYVQGVEDGMEYTLCSLSKTWGSETFILQNTSSGCSGVYTVKLDRKDKGGC